MASRFASAAPSFLTSPPLQEKRSTPLSGGRSIHAPARSRIYHPAKEMEISRGLLYPDAGTTVLNATLGDGRLFEKRGFNPPPLRCRADTDPLSSPSAQGVSLPPSSRLRR